MRIREIAQAHAVRYGYRKIRVLLNREGWKVGKKLVYRLYREEGLGAAHRRRQEPADASRRIDATKSQANSAESGVEPGLRSRSVHRTGGRFRALTVVDVFTRESLAIEVGQSLKGPRCGAGAEPNQPTAGCAENSVLR